MSVTFSSTTYFALIILCCHIACHDGSINKVYYFCSTSALVLLEYILPRRQLKNLPEKIPENIPQKMHRYQYKGIISM